jgi:diguanylate cyclase (GGDEF)-like protein
MRSGWTLVLAAEESRLMAGIATRGWVLLGVLMLVTSGVLLASWWQLRALAGGMRGLLEAMAGLGPGERLPDEIRARMPRELAPVAAAIDALARRLGEAYAGLEDALSRERRLAASLQDVVARREQEIAERTGELREAVAELDRLSRTDPLTGALNIRGLDEWFAATWPALRADSPRLGVLAMDVDLFKAFNDAYGHPAGDAALKRVVGAVRGALRGPGDQIVRMGGEEFLVLLPGADAAATREAGERARRAIETTDIPNAAAPGGVLTASFGVAAVELGDGEDIRHARAAADRALYQAKHDGRNTLRG